MKWVSKRASVSSPVFHSTSLSSLSSLDSYCPLAMSTALLEKLGRNASKTWRRDYKYNLREHLSKLDIHKSLDPDRMYPWLLRGLEDTIWSHLWSSFKGRGDQERCLRRERKCQLCLQKGQEGEPKELQLSPWKERICLILEAICTHKEEKKVISLDSLNGIKAWATWSHSMTEPALGRQCEWRPPEADVDLNFPAMPDGLAGQSFTIFFMILKQSVILLWF